MVFGGMKRARVLSKNSSLVRGGATKSAGHSTSNSTVRGSAAQGNWALDDLKRIQGASGQRRAESLLRRVRRLANNFIHGSEQDTQAICFDNEEDLRRSLFLLNPASKVLRIEGNLICVRAPRIDGLPRLFAPYGLKGGAARIAVLALLGHDTRQLRPRDVDLVRFGGAGSAEQRALDDSMAAEHMAADFAHGHGVEVCESIDRYLATRDFTLNEAVLMGGQLVLTRHCLEDSYSHVVRATPHLLSQGSTLDGKMLMKALRLCAEFRGRGYSSELADVPMECFASPFDVALHLSRALELSEGAAKAYLDLVFAHGALDAREFGACSIEEVKAGLLEVLGPGVELFSEPSEVVRPVGLGFTASRS